MDNSTDSAASNRKAPLIAAAAGALCLLLYAGGANIKSNYAPTPSGGWDWDLGGVGVSDDAAGDAKHASSSRSVRRRRANANANANAMVNEMLEGGGESSAAEEDDSVVTTIALIGERHSGTNWIANHLEQCFGDDLQIHVSYSRFKHWFQYDTSRMSPKATAVVAMFRDPYDWVEAMHEQPHHAHEHMGLNWRQFVTKPWIGPRRGGDDARVEKAGGLEEAIVEAGYTCLANFTWNEVVPCSVEDNAFIDGVARYMYELNHDGSGEPYPSIVDLRRAKILNFLSMTGMKGVKSFHPYRYEDMSRYGTSSILRTLEKATGKKAKCEPYPATGYIKHKPVKADYIDWMNENVDWDVEEMIGYFKKNP